ncbi:uncharacterized protein LOC110739371 [Chenopodium quinoa]|uniref:uncharacterized protein LOC110739371 n=1 Tax=Chenopodium quinoa TaxID=63459 RepID=UPI000B771E17|nr:uncharacterized protein LOC110739371 [Chenopodium quinoa]
MTVSDKNNEMMTHSKMFETQITQLANPLKESASPSSLPYQGSDPKKLVYYITTRSGKVLEESISRKSKEGEKVSDLCKEDNHDMSRRESTDAKEKAKIEENVQEDVIKLKLPYPQKFLRSKINDQFGIYLDMLKEIHLSIPFTNSLTQMPNYSRFLKEILSVKRVCNEVELVDVGECCSALIHNDLPPKMKYLGNFSIPCKINDNLFQNALYDLGASVSTDRYTKFPKGKIEDVPLKIGDFTIPVDFIVLEIAEDDNIPIILGRPFLATSGALIDMRGGLITLRVGDDKSSFKLKSMYESLSYVKGIMFVNSPLLNDNVCMVVSSSNDVCVVRGDVSYNVES